jgi:cytochrome c biogenesis protein CcmG, thiol:disulfide interchange protein DsbE
MANPSGLGSSGASSTADPNSRQRAILLVLVVLLAIGGLAAATGHKHGHGLRPAPELPTQVLVAPQVTIASLRGRPAFINFFASWCGPCRAEAAQLTQFARASSSRARVVGVDWSDPVAAARRFIVEHHLTYPIVRDGTGGIGSRQYRLVKLPTTYVLDSSGRIADVLSGQQTFYTLEVALHAVGCSGGPAANGNPVFLLLRLC